MSAEFRGLSAFLVVLSAVVLLSGCTSERLRICTYNIRHGEGADKRVNLARTASVINAERPDFVALQEVERGRIRSGRLDETAELARLTGLHGVFGPALHCADGGDYGVAILSREKPLSTASVPLPGLPLIEPRVLLVAEYADLYFASTHLANAVTNAPFRLASADTIAAEARKSDKPFFVCGDWNDGPDSATLKRFGERFRLLTETDAPTFFGYKPRTRARRLDYVAVDRAHADGFASDGGRVVRAEGVSDHALVVVDVSKAEEK